MPDGEETTQEETKTDATEETTSSSVDEGNEGGEGGGEGSGEGDGDGSKKSDEEAAAAAAKKSEDDAKEPEVRKRKTPAEFIRERQARKAEKAKKAEEAHDGDDEGERDDEIPEADQETIGKVAGEIVRPLIEKHLQSEDAAEVAEFLAKPENDVFAPYKEKALKWMNHPSRRNMPISSIFYEVAGPDLMRIGAERERKASEKARDTQAGGNSSRGDGEAKSVWELSPEEFAAKQAAVRSKQNDD